MSVRAFLLTAGIMVASLQAQKPGVPVAKAPATKPAAAAPMAAAPASAPAAPAQRAPDLLVERLPVATDSVLQLKLDSISHSVEAGVAVRDSATTANAAKAVADSARSAIEQGKYVSRVQYDMSNFDHWKVDSVYQKKMKSLVQGEWRTRILAHGHAFRDASLRFGANDTLYGTTRTYSDSGRYQMTGEYKFQARYRFDNDSTIVSREVFVDRNVVRWDHIKFRIDGDKLLYHLSKLEFRDLNDNWLNAVQGFEHVEPEAYYRAPGPAR